MKKEKVEKEEKGEKSSKRNKKCIDDLITTAIASIIGTIVLTIILLIAMEYNVAEQAAKIKIDSSVIVKDVMSLNKHFKVIDDLEKRHRKEILDINQRTSTILFMARNKWKFIGFATLIKNKKTAVVEKDGVYFYHFSTSSAKIGFISHAAIKNFENSSKLKDLIK